jgi:hypothetical protein
LFSNRSSSTDSSITGEANKSLFSTGLLSISSSFAYLDFTSVAELSDVDSALQYDSGNAAAAKLPATVVEMNLRRFVLISVFLFY